VKTISIVLLTIAAITREYADLLVNAQGIKIVLKKKIALKTIAALIMDIAELDLNIAMTNSTVKRMMTAILMNVAPILVIAELDQNIVGKKQQNHPNQPQSRLHQQQSHPNQQQSHPNQRQSQCSQQL